MAFAHLKVWMRRNASLAEDFAANGNFAGGLELAIREFQKEIDMEGPWRDAGLV